MLLAIIIESIVLGCLYAMLWFIRPTLTDNTRRRVYPFVATSLGLWAASYFVRMVPPVETMGLGAALLCGIFALGLIHSHHETSL